MRKILTAAFRFIVYAMLWAGYAFFVYVFLLPGLEIFLVSMFFPDLAGSSEALLESIRRFHEANGGVELAMALILATDAIWARVERKRKGQPRKAWRKR